MGVADWFSTFCQVIQVQSSDTISARYRAITKRLNTEFWGTDSDLSHSLYVGSYGRNTAIEGFSDLDMVFELPIALYSRYNSYGGNGQSALLQLVKSSIEKTYSRTSLRADGQVIVVKFSDGMNFEVVPVFANGNGSFLFPDANSGGSWRTTNPRPEISAIRQRNAETNGNLVRLCRIMRKWKAQWTVPIGGLLLDTLAYQFIDSWVYKDKSFFYYDFMCRDFLQWAASRDESQDFWRAPGSGQYVYGKGLFQYKAKRCYRMACEAIAYEQCTPKLEFLAREKWREIFGTQFPN